MGKVAQIAFWVFILCVAYQILTKLLLDFLGTYIEQMAEWIADRWVEAEERGPKNRRKFRGYVNTHPPNKAEKAPENDHYEEMREYDALFHAGDVEGQKRGGGGQCHQERGGLPEDGQR